MPVVLPDDTETLQVIALGDGVTITLAPITYPDFAAAHGEALRRAADEVIARGPVDADAVPQPPGVQALTEAYVLDELVARHATGWAGVFDTAGEPVALTRENWVRFRDARPTMALHLRQHLQTRPETYVAEGNA